VRALSRGGGGRALDVLEIDGASNRGIDEVRTLRENARYAPARGRRKVYIIDEVHMLTEPAFNALLKTLEEPPAHVVFVLATTEARRLPATILSRCQRFDFRPIASAEIGDALRRILEEEKVAADAVEPDALRLLARRPTGASGTRCPLLDTALAYGEGRSARGPWRSSWAVAAPRPPGRSPAPSSGARRRRRSSGSPTRRRADSISRSSARRRWSSCGGRSWSR
jgi:DNA polymerase III subunit gamma/tau